MVKWKKRGRWGVLDASLGVVFIEANDGYARAYPPDADLWAVKVYAGRG